MFREADGCAQIHHGLIEVAGPGGRDERLRRIIQRLFFPRGVSVGSSKSNQAAQDADHVSVHGGCALSEGDARDGAGHVGAKARQATEGAAIGSGAPGQETSAMSRAARWRLRARR